jgi:RHS repeat-associated protein
VPDDLLSDPLGSNSVALNNTGQVIGLEHDSPYGTVDSQWGSMPTSFTSAGERLDSQTGLLYDNFRYDDPLSGRCVRADTVQDNSTGMDPYAYVGDNPETQNDPMGHMYDRPETDFITPASTANTILSTSYGIISGYTQTKMGLLQAYIDDPQGADPWLRAYIKSLTGDRYVASRVKNATATIEGLEGPAKALRLFGNILLFGSAILDGLSSGMDYFNQHPDQGVAGAVGVGIGHAALSTAGAVVGASLGQAGGEAIGAVLGSFIPIPGVGTALGMLAGGAIGGAVGGFVGSWVGDQVATSLAPVASAVGNAVGNVVSSVGNWLGSLF